MKNDDCVKIEIRATFLQLLFGFNQAFLHQAAVELLDVCVHALPVGLLHPD